MIPIYELDNQTFEEIVEEAIKKIPQIAPEWTNLNLSDPGITLIELMAFMKESLQFSMNQVTNQNRRKFLKLLGITPRAVYPSMGYVGLTGVEQEDELHANYQFLAGNIVFETMRSTFICKANATGITTVAAGEQFSGDLVEMRQERLRYPLFGENPKQGDQFYILFDRPFEKEELVSIYFDIVHDYPVARNQLNAREEFTPLAELLWEVYTDTGFEQMKVLFDGTHQFLHSGLALFRMKGASALRAEAPGGYLIRVTLKQCDYDVAPVLGRVSLNYLPVRQQETLADFTKVEVEFLSPIETVTVEMHHFLASVATIRVFLEERGVCREITNFTLEQTRGKGAALRLFAEGFPDVPGKHTLRVLYHRPGYGLDKRICFGDGMGNQQIFLEDIQIVEEGVEILVEDPQEKSFQIYRQVEDFEHSSPESLHFVYDPIENCIWFGDSEKGCAPDGNIYFSRLITSFGRLGNVKSHRINRAVEPGAAFCVDNPENTAYGEDAETLEECFLRFRRDFRRTSRAVTARDYLWLVKRSPGLMIRDCQIISTEALVRPMTPPPQNVVALVVEPYSDWEQVAPLGEAYRKNLTRMLAEKKLIGTRIELISPVAIAVRVYLELTVSFRAKDAENLSETVVRQYIEQRERRYGGMLSYSTLFGKLDSLDCVVEVRSLSLESKQVTANMHGDLVLPHFGVPLLEKITCSINVAE